MLVIGRVAAALLAGALLAQAYGLQPYWPLAWAAAIPLLVAVIGASRVNAFLCGAIAGALSVAGMFAYMLELTGPAPLAVIVVLKALIWGGAALAASFAERRLPAPAAVFVFPALMAGVETLIAAVSPHGTAGAFAYSQMDFLPVIQVASLGGAPAITFVVMLFASAVAFLIAKRVLLAAIAPALLVAAALGWGSVRLQQAPQHVSQGPTIGVLRIDRFEGVPADWRGVLGAYGEALQLQALPVVPPTPYDDELQDTDVLVWPEKIAFLGEHELDEALGEVAALARQYDTYIVAGVVAQQGDAQFNRAFVVAPTGETAFYDKRRLVPGLESHLAIGRADYTFVLEGQRIGVAVCKDFDFPDLMRGYARRGVDIMLAPSWDFDVDGWLHARMAMLRAVEGGFSLARNAREGRLTFSDAYGRVLSENWSSGRGASFGTSRLLAGVPTLYARVGDVLGWACLALAALLLGGAFWRRREV
jgi:apolipoprotein N-acyltransferase